MTCVYGSLLWQTNPCRRAEKETHEVQLHRTNVNGMADLDLLWVGTETMTVLTLLPWLSFLMVQR